MLDDLHAFWESTWVLTETYLSFTQDLNFQNSGAMTWGNPFGSDFFKYKSSLVVGLRQETCMIVFMTSHKVIVVFEPKWLPYLIASY